MIIWSYDCMIVWLDRGIQGMPQRLPLASALSARRPIGCTCKVEQAQQALRRGSQSSDDEPTQTQRAQQLNQTTIVAENVAKRVAAVWRCCEKRGETSRRCLTLLLQKARLALKWWYDHMVIWSYDHMIVYASYDHVIIWSHDHMVIWSYDHTWSSYDHTIARSRAHMIIWSYDHMLTSSYDRMIICSYDHMIIWLYYHMTIWSYDRAIIRSHDLLPLLVWPLLPSTNMWKRAGKGDPFCRLMTPFTVDNPVFQTCAQQGVSI